jgi:FeS assembly SUF system regulator
MLRMSKLTDYGLVLLTHMARAGAPEVVTAHELADASKVPLPTVAKLLKELSRAGIVISHRGRRGGYTLARPAAQISVAAVIEALEGPVALTECSITDGNCSLEAVCPAKAHWGPVSRAIQRTLSRLPISALGPRATQPEAAVSAADGRSDPTGPAPSHPRLTVLTP